MQYQHLLEEFVASAKETMGAALTGVYLHGSLAMHCFNPDKSDIDLLLVIEKEISDAVKMEFMKHVLRLNGQGPAKGLELSVVRREVLNPFVYPTPFELHFSLRHQNWFLENPEDYVKCMKGVDKDLAAHVTMINQYGITLFGEPIGAVFAPVPKEAYVDSILLDVEHAKDDILDQPVYMTLNLCRVLAFLKDGLYLSKREGGKWGLRHLPGFFRPQILQAVECYGTSQNTRPESELAEQFADRMLEWIEEAKQQTERVPDENENGSC